MITAGTQDTAGAGNIAESLRAAAKSARRFGIANPWEIATTEILPRGFCRRNSHGYYNRRVKNH